MSLTKLENYLPEGALSHVEKWINDQSLNIHITRNRKTKLGDYKYLPTENLHQITINGDLTPEAFFFVLTHEIAHFHIKLFHKRKVKPHGTEWKRLFGALLIESVTVYNEDIQPFIANHAQNAKASVGADRLLYGVLFENPYQKKVEDLFDKQKFRIGNKVFERGKKQKIRYICRELRTGRKYSVSGLAIIDEILE